MPIFLKNSPQVICKQVLWLIKNSNQDFQAKETPFCFQLSVKKRFAQHWNSFPHQNWNPSPPHPNRNPSPPHQNSSTSTTSPTCRSAQDVPLSGFQFFETVEEQEKSKNQEYLEEIKHLKNTNKDIDCKRQNLEKDLFQTEQTNKKVFKENREIRLKLKVVFSSKDMKE